MESVPNTFWDLFYGYTALWLIVCYFLFHLGAQQRKLKLKIDAFQHELKSLEKAHDERSSQLRRVS